ncbi:MAG TPA: HNH endonuclease signature motif containing protein [Thermoplasmata archaeon]|nr:HNH endonuclease signature motif containing protein [Thermoplasmata archaeon]
MSPDPYAAAEGPSAPGRVLRRSAAWFTEGRHRKADARRRRRCVECDRPLDSGRTPYCGRLCQWRFQGRYFWDAARTYVIHRDRFTCRACRTRHRVRELEVDHIVEIARGGASLDYGNLQTMCRPCHRGKTIRFLRDRRSSPRGPIGAAALAPTEEGAEWFPA